jgi:acyl-CoA synthetase (AMP-forming)/AMP-acid ligase II
MDKHLTDYLRGHAEKTPDKPAVISNERTLSWLQLWQEVEAAAGIISHQVTGDSQQVVALLMPNGWQFVVAYLGIIHAGHIGMPVDVIYKPLEIDAILEQMNPMLLITDTPERTSVKIKKLNPSELKGSDREHLRLPAGKQIASLVFTSGTTGKPNGGGAQTTPCSLACAYPIGMVFVWG